MCEKCANVIWTSEYDEIMIYVVNNNETLYNVYDKDYNKAELNKICLHLSTVISLRPLETDIPFLGNCTFKTREQIRTDTETQL